MHVAGTHAGKCIGILIAGRAAREDDRPRVQRRVGIADVGAVRLGSNPVPVRTVRGGKRSAGLEGRDPGNRPSAQRMFPPARPGPGNRPKICNRQPVRAIEIAHAAINLQPSQGYRNRSEVHPGLLNLYISDAVAGAVDELRPGIGRSQLKTARKAAVQAPLQGMIGGVSLAGASVRRSKRRIEARSCG